jgi:hypothetical protein
MGKINEGKNSYTNRHDATITKNLSDFFVTVGFLCMALKRETFASTPG